MEKIEFNNKEDLEHILNTNKHQHLEEESVNSVIVIDKDLTLPNVFILEDLKNVTIKSENKTIITSDSIKIEGSDIILDNIKIISSKVNIISNNLKIFDCQFKNSHLEAEIQEECVIKNSRFNDGYAKIVSEHNLVNVEDTGFYDTKLNIESSSGEVKDCYFKRSDDKSMLKIDKCNDFKVDSTVLEGETKVKNIGLKVYRCDKVKVEDCRMESIQKGIVIRDTRENVEIKDSRIQNCETGVMDSINSEGIVLNNIDFRKTNNKIVIAHDNIRVKNNLDILLEEL